MSNKMEFFKGMGMGVVAGAALALTCSPGCSCHKKPSAKKGIGKFAKAVGDIMDDVADAVGM